MADAGGVDEAEGDAAELNGVFDGIAGGALYVADNGALLAEQGVEQGAFAYVGRSDDGYVDAVLEGVARMKGVGKTGDVGIGFLSQRQQFRAVGELKVFVVGEVEFEF